MTYCCWLAQWEQHYCCLSLSSLLLLLYTGHRKVLVVFSFLILLSIGCFLLQYFFVTYNVGNNNNTSSYYQGRVAVPHYSLCGPGGPHPPELDMPLAVSPVEQPRGRGGVA